MDRLPAPTTARPAPTPPTPLADPGQPPPAYPDDGGAPPPADALAVIARTGVRPTGEVPRCRWCGARMLAATTVCDDCAESLMPDGGTSPKAIWWPAPPVIWLADGYVPHRSTT